MTKRTVLMGFVWAIGCVAGSIVICFVAIRVYLAHEARRAGELLKDLQSVEIGESEATARSISQKYGGYQWVNIYKPDYDDSDYEYIPAVNPWRYGTISGHTTRFDQQIKSLANKVSPRWRHALGLRKWLVGGDIRIKKGRVVSVSGTMIAEGKDKWLGGNWNFAAEIPRSKLERYPEKSPETQCYVAEYGHLLWDDEGEILMTWITPAASASDSRSGRQLNVGCLMSRSGCPALSDLMPGAAAQYRLQP